MPSRTGKHLLAGLLFGLAARVPAARADESNFRPYLVGTRAAGMGGAFTALADDGSGAYYNPGGLAFVRRSQLSLSGSVYGIVGGGFQDALGNGHDFNYRNLNAFPTATSGVWKLSGPEPSDEADVLALSVFVPDAVNIDDRDTLGSQQNAFFYGDQSQTVWGGLSYARRMGRVGIGATGFVLFGTRLSHLDLTAVSAASQSTFATLSGRIDETFVAFVGALGIRWDATDELRLGLSVYSPAVGSGSRRVFARLTAGDNVASPGAPAQVAVVNADGLHASPSLPLRAQAGAAWVQGRLTLAADVVLLAARSVSDDADRALEGLDKRVVRNAVVNGSLGLEYVIDDRFPLRAGLFTDFSAANSPVAYSSAAGPDPNASNTSHVDRFGGTLSIGYRTDHTSTDLGVSISGGTGTDLVPDNLDFSQYKASSSSQLFVYVFLGTSYEF
jgi:long-chain fatty acid transport protein